MRASILTGCLMTAVVAAAALPLSGPVFAADLDGEAYVEPPYDDRYDYGRYDGGRYSSHDGDRYEDRYGEAPPPDRDQEPYGEPRRGSIKDGYPVPVPPPRYGERPPLPERDYACLDRWQIKRQLRDDGWAGIRPMGGDGAVVYLRARRFESGRVFNLRVDRCSGDVLAARPEYLRSFAFRDRPWRDRY